MSEKIPVIFFHIGNHDYFHGTLNLASKYNNVIVIGDQSDNFKKLHPNIKFENLNQFLNDVENFKNTYVHMHLSHPDIQLICYLRWIIIRNYCYQRNINRFFHADSDLAIVSDLTEIYYKHVNHDFALATMSYQPTHRLVASAHASYWKIDVLNNFCDFLFTSYQQGSIKNKLNEKFKWHQETNNPGGVCDMTQLYLFSLENPHVSLTKVNDNTCFDDNVNSGDNYEPNEYITENQAKKIMVKNNQFYFLNKEKEPVLAYVIHCQGIAKDLINMIWNHVKGLE